MNIRKLIINNIVHQKNRSGLLIILTFVLSFILSITFLVSNDISKGYSKMTDRLGSDLIIVPADNMSNMEDILLQGTPSSFYIDKSILNNILNIKGIKSVTTQFYLQSLNAACCSSPIQLIGYDEDTDTSIQAWIAEEYDNDGLIIGSKVGIKGDDTIKIFGRTYPIKAILDETDTGLDFSVYCNKNNMQKMYEDALNKKAIDKNVNPDTHTSAVFINIEDGYDKSKVISELNKISDIRVVEANDITDDIFQNMENTNLIMKCYSVLFVLLSIVAMSIVSMLTANERQQEFAILRMVGGTKNKIRLAFACEMLIVSFIGSLIGSISGVGLVSQFSILISDILQLPFNKTDIGFCIVLILSIMLFNTLLVFLTTVKTFTKIGTAEESIIMKK